MAKGSGGQAAGILVMAYGKRLYQHQAVDLAVSLRLRNPQIPLALVTEWPHHRTSRLFDHVIGLDGPRRHDCRPKLDMDLLTPFRRTLYIDSDGLAVRDVDFLFDRFAAREFVVHGSNISTGQWYGNVHMMCQLAGSLTVPKFNSGFMYFQDSTVTAGVFRTARKLTETYEQRGFDRFNGGIADEPLLSIGLARHGVRAVPTMPDASASLIGTLEPPEMDVLSGRATFLKYGRRMEPAIVHFAADHSSAWRREGATYRRQRRTLGPIKREMLAATESGRRVKERFR
jgi:hypothetical protein